MSFRASDSTDRATPVARRTARRTLPSEYTSQTNQSSSTVPAQRITGTCGSEGSQLRRCAARCVMGAACGIEAPGVCA